MVSMEHDVSFCYDAVRHFSGLKIDILIMKFKVFQQCHMYLSKGKTGRLSEKCKTLFLSEIMGIWQKKNGP